MSDLLMGELLCLFLLIIINGRIFFPKHKNGITIAVLSPVVLFVSIFQLLAQGCSFFELTILILSLLTFVSNIHAFSRFVSHLYVDRYRLGFYLNSLFLLICSFAMTALVIYFREIPIRAKDYGVVETKENLRSINANNGSINAILWTYKSELQEEPLSLDEDNLLTENLSHESSLHENLSSENPESELENTTNNSTNNSKKKKPIIIFSADERSDTHRYRPYLILLAKEGYTVYSLDVFDRKVSYFSSILDFPVLRRSAMIFHSFYQKDEFDSFRLKMTESMKQEYKVLREIALERNGTNTALVAIGDEMQEHALEYFNDVQNIKGTFLLTSIDMYKNKGFGCIAQTAPFLAYLIGEDREKSLIIPSYMAKQTDKYIMSIKDNKR